VFLAWIIDQPEIELVHHVRVAEVRVRIRERERTAGSGKAECMLARAEADVWPRPSEAE